MPYKEFFIVWAAIVALELLFIAASLLVLIVRGLVIRRRRILIYVELAKIDQLDPISAYLYIKKARYPKKILGKNAIKR